MSDAPIIVEVTDKIPDGPAKKLIAIAEAAERAHAQLSRVNAEAKLLDPKGFRAMQAAATANEVATLRVQRSQEMLKAATERTAKAQAQAQAAQARAQAETQRASNVSVAFAQTTDRLRMAQERLTMAKDRAANATARLSAAERKAQREQAAILAERSRQSQLANQAAFNSVLGIGNRATNSARASAAVFKESFAAEKAAASLAAAQTKAAEAAKRHTAASAVLAKQTGLTNYQVLTLQYTVNDVIASLASGASVSTILAQQGGQVAQAWGGVGALFRALAGAIATPVGAMVSLAAAGAGVLAFVDSAEGKFARLQRDLQLTNNYAGLTADAFMAMSDSVATATNRSIAESREVTMALTQSGRIQSDQIQQLAVVTLNLAKVTGRSTADIVAEFDKAADAPARYARELDRQLNFLSAADLAQIRNLEERGRKTEALSLLSSKLYTYLGTEAPKSLSNLSSAWNWLTRAISDAYTKAENFARSATPAETLAQAVAARARMVEMAARVNQAPDPEALAQADAYIAKLRAAADATERQAKAQGENARLQAAGKDAAEYLGSLSSSLADNSERAAREIAKFRKSLDDAGKANPNDANYLSALKNRAAIEQKIRDQYMPARAKAAKAAVADEERYEYVLSRVNAELDGEAKLIGLVAEQRARQQKINEIEQRFLRTKRALTGEDRTAILAKVDANIAEERSQAALQSAYTAIAGPMVNYAAQQQAILALLDSGSISFAEYNRQMIINREAYLNASDPMREINRQFEAERALIDAVGQEKVVLSRYMQIEQTLLSRGIDLKAQENAAERERILGLLRSQNAHERLTSAVQAYRDETVGALEEITIKQTALDQAYSRGYIGLEAYRASAVQLNAEVARINIAQGVGTQVDIAMSAFARMLDGYRGMYDGMADITGNFLASTTDRFSNAVGQWVVEGGSLGDALGQAARQGIGELVSGLVRLGLQWIIMKTLGDTLAASSLVTTAATASATAAAWAPAAALASLATLGANAAPAGAAIVGTVALSEALAVLPGFRAGGYTGNSPVDQISGVVHGREYVTDAAATERYRPLLDAMNSGASPSRVAQTAGAMAGGTQLRVVIEDHTSGVRFDVQQLSETEVRVIARQEVEKHSDGAVAKSLSDPNSRVSRSLSKHTATRRTYA